MYKKVVVRVLKMRVFHRWMCKRVFRVPLSAIALFLLTLGTGESRKPVPLGYRTPNRYNILSAPPLLKLLAAGKESRNPAADTEGVLWAW